MILMVVDTQRGCFDERLFAFEKVKKNINSAFHKMTGLTDYLLSKNEKDIITIGVSTDYCMDATIKSGFEQGFHMIVLSFANSTYDNPYFSKEIAYKYYNEFMWPKRYATVVSVDEAIKMMEYKG